MLDTLYVGQGKAKDCVVGDRLMNRYAIFNGLERPRRIDPNLEATILGFDAPTITSVTSVATAGSLENGKWYSYKAVYASYKYRRPVAVADDTLDWTRGNGSTVSSAQATAGASSMDVVVPGTTVAGITHILLYRSLGATTQAIAEEGPFYYAAMAVNAVGNVTINDGTADDALGIELESDNYPPNSYRYAIAAAGFLFAGGNYMIGTGYTATVTIGSSTVTLSGPLAYDGVRGWCFKCKDDTSGGVDNSGLYYCNYVSPTTVQLIDEEGVAKNYNGTTSDAKTFNMYLPGYILRWCKQGEPESWPLTNSITFEGDITGLAAMPNQPLILIFTDTPSIHVLDLTLIGTSSFKTSRRLISTEYTTTSHYSLCPVGQRLRGIDMHKRLIWECDGVSITDITKLTVPKIFSYLSNNEWYIQNWHCAYDPGTKIFGAFVAMNGSHRIVDFCIGQHVPTGSWFFHWERDLLCTGYYTDPLTGESMVLGGTQGLPVGGGAVWGRIWAPNTYDEWIPASSLRSGTILSATDSTITVDVTGGTNLWNSAGGLAGRWVMVCDANGENAQVAYILSNTADTITISTVVNSLSATEFSPVPVAGWLFYLGMIEMRWGPKWMDFGDPDSDKKVNEVCFVLSSYDSTMLPFIRIFRGLETGYLVQRAVEESTYRDSGGNEGLYSRVKAFGEPMPRFGLAIIDRSYNPCTLRSVTVVHHPIAGVEGEK